MHVLRNTELIAEKHSNLLNSNLREFLKISMVMPQSLNHDIASKFLNKMKDKKKK